MQNPLIRYLIAVVIIGFIAKSVFPLISYNPGAGAADFSSYLLILLGIGAIIFKIVRLKQQ